MKTAEQHNEIAGATLRSFNFTPDRHAEHIKLSPCLMGHRFGKGQTCYCGRLHRDPAPALGERPLPSLALAVRI